MRTGYSPFDMCNEAVQIIASYKSGLMTAADERQVILLLNMADSYKEMSAYQMSIARKKFADYYYSNNFTGSALEQYQLAIEINPKLSVKKRLKELLLINKCDLIYSLDANMVGKPDMSNLKYYELPQSLIDPAEQLKRDIKSANFHGMSLNEYRKWIYDLREKAERELRLEAEKENSVYDPEFDEFVQSELDKLGDDDRKSFYDLLQRHDFEKDYPYSYKKWAVSTLQSFWKSKKASDVHRTQLDKVRKLDLSNTSFPALKNPNLTPEEMLFLQYLHHKKTSLEDIAGYWTHEYHMDYEYVIPKFFSMGLLQYADLNYTLQKCTIAEMNKLLPKQEATIKRKKGELIQVLLSKKENPALDSYKKMYYEVTPEGKKYLSGQDYPKKDVSFRY